MGEIERTAFERTGFEFGPAIGLWRRVTLPDGWTARAHGKHDGPPGPIVVDALGRTRLAFIGANVPGGITGHLVAKYMVWDRPWNERMSASRRVLVVTDVGVEVFRSDWFRDDDMLHRFEISRSVQEWLAREAPAHVDPTAYW